MAETGQLRLASQNRVTKYPSARTPPTVSPPSEGACHGPADVQLIRAVSSLGSSGWRALEPNQFGPAILFPFGGLLLGLVMLFGMTQRALREI